MTRSDRWAAVAFVATVTLALMFIIGSLWPADAARYNCRTIIGHPCVVKPPLVPGTQTLCPRPTPAAPPCPVGPPLKPQPPIHWTGGAR